MSISEDVIRSVIREKYNRKVVTISTLDGYVDVNFKVDIVDECSDENFGYETVIMKITTNNIETINLQNRIMTYLAENGISTCTPIKTTSGDTTCKVNIGGGPVKDSDGHVCTVLSYIPGITLRSAGNPVYLMEDVGRWAGRVDKLLQTYQKDDPQHTHTIWELTRAPEVGTLIEKYCDVDVKELGWNVINAFKEKILPDIGSFQKGYIHGDFNDCNFIVSQTTKTADRYTISGVIDYGDACVSFYVYEIATLMADMMSVCLGKQNPVEIGKLILRGYRQEFELKSVELVHLKLVICVRMIQYYVLGAEILEKDPDNEYVGLDRDEYIKMCKRLWDMDDERFRLDFIEDEA